MYLSIILSVLNYKTRSVEKHFNNRRKNISTIVGKILTAPEANASEAVFENALWHFIIIVFSILRRIAAGYLTFVLCLYVFELFTYFGNTFNDCIVYNLKINLTVLVHNSIAHPLDCLPRYICVRFSKLLS